MKTKTEYFNKSELVNFANGIPSELRELNIWVGFKYRPSSDNSTKMKKQPVCIEKLLNNTMGAYSETENPANHCSFDTALSALKDSKVDGIGIYLVNTPYTVIDIDGGVTWVNDSPMLSFDANTMLEMFDSWAEFSSSGNGIHIFIKGKKPTKKFEYRFCEVGGEIYDGNDGHRSFIAMTGYGITDTESINERQSALDSFCEEVWKLKPVTTNRTESDGGGFKKANVVTIENHKLTDTQIIDFIIKGKDDENETRRKLYQMWMGTYQEDDLSMYELKFITNLLFWTQKDEAQTFSVFCQSPYAMGICKTNNPVTLDELIRARGKSKTYYQNRFNHALNFFGDAGVYKGNTTVFSNGENANVEESEDVPTVEEVKEIIDGIPTLPGIAAIDYSLGDDVCTWLDDYIAHSKRVSTKGASTFHIAAGLWLLSTVAAGRLVGNEAGCESTSLYFMFLSQSSLYRKSTTAKVATDILDTIGLNALVLPEAQTPQAMIKSISESEQKRRLGDKNLKKITTQQLKIQFPGQRAWYYDEFGNNLKQIMRTGSPLNDYLGIFKTFYDGPTTYTKDTINRGYEIVSRPYIALLASTTPDDFKGVGNKDSVLWGDGTFARFIFIPPMPNEAPSKVRRENDFIEIPDSLKQPLLEWHNRLGIPQIDFDYLDADWDREDDKKSEEVTNNIDVESAVGALNINKIKFSNEAHKAYYDYQEALESIAYETNMGKLTANYTRLSINAARIAVLFASFEGSNLVELKHWAKAQKIMEDFRALLHHTVSLIGEANTNAKSDLEDEVVTYIKRVGPSTVAALRRDRFKNKFTDTELSDLLEKLAKVGILVADRNNKKVKYAFNTEQE